MDGIYGKLAGAIVVLAIPVVAYFWGLKAGRAERDAAVSTAHAECLADQRDLAIRTADAYGAELEAQRKRAISARSAERNAQVRLSAAAQTIAAQVRVIKDARDRVGSACFTDDLRMRIDAVGDALDDRHSPNQTPDAGPASGVHGKVRFDTGSHEGAGPRDVGS